MTPWLLLLLLAAILLEVAGTTRLKFAVSLSLTARHA